MSAQELGYARALRRASPGLAPRVLDELKAASELISAHGRYFGNPMTRAGEREDVLRDVFSESFCGLTMEFLAFLARKRKLGKLPDIVRRLEDMLRQETGRNAIRLRVPFQPSPELLVKMRAYFVGRGLLSPDRENEAGIDVVIDKTLLGGFIAECGGLVLDHSLSSRLGRLLRR